MSSAGCHKARPDDEMGNGGYHKGRPDDEMGDGGCHKGRSDDGMGDGGRHKGRPDGGMGNGGCHKGRSDGGMGNGGYHKGRSDDGMRDGGCRKGRPAKEMGGGGSSEGLPFPIILKWRPSAMARLKKFGISHSKKKITSSDWKVVDKGIAGDRDPNGSFTQDAKKGALARRSARQVGVSQEHVVTDAWGRRLIGFAVTPQPVLRGTVRLRWIRPGPWWMRYLG